MSGTQKKIKGFSPSQWRLWDKLSMGVKKKFQTWFDNQLERERIAWDDTFMNKAKEAAKRSWDAETQVGAVLIDPKAKTVISEGYNGPVRDALDQCIPNYRPDKYPFSIHAEHNCILNAARLGRSTLGSVCYCTHLPCVYHTHGAGCLQFLWNAGIVEVVYDEEITNMTLGDEQQQAYEIFNFLIQGKMRIRQYKSSG